MRISERDEQFRNFYLTQAPRLRRLAIMLTGDVERASDLTHDTLTKVYVKWPRIRDDEPGSYARTILVNACRTAHRRRLLEIRKTPRQPATVPDPTHSIDRALQIATALSALSPIRRAVILLRFYDDMTEQQIADSLNRPLNTVKSDLRRALETLRPMFGDEVREMR